MSRLAGRNRHKRIRYVYSKDNRKELAVARAKAENA
jgi:hypothetical protein